MTKITRKITGAEAKKLSRKAAATAATPRKAAESRLLSATEQR